MARRDFGGKKWERWGVSAAACLVGAACIMTGVYIDEMSDVKDDGYVVDLSKYDQKEVESDKEEAKEEQKELAPANAVDSKKVINQPEIKKPKQEIVDDLDALDLPEEIKAKAVVEEIPENEIQAKEVNNQALVFGIDSKLDWPVKGDVIIDYSMNQTVLFPTLNQYKYNPGLYIAAKEGDEILASCEAEVEAVSKEDELGNVLALNLGDGYTLKLGQLEDITVSEGERVQKGQVIGHLSKATKYHVAEGDSLYMELKKDGNPVNPTDFLVNR